MSIKATAKTTWKSGQKCHGTYHDIKFTGVINDNTRPTPDYRNIMFHVTLDEDIVVYGRARTTLCIETHSNENHLFIDDQ